MGSVQTLTRVTLPCYLLAIESENFCFWEEGAPGEPEVIKGNDPDELFAS